MTNFTMKDKYRLFLYISEGFESSYFLDEELQNIIDPNFGEDNPYFALCPVGGEQSNHYATWYANSSMVELGVPNQGLSDVLELGHKHLKDATMGYIFSNGNDPKAVTLEARCKEQSVPHKVIVCYNSRHLRVPFATTASTLGFTSSLAYKVAVEGRDYFVAMAEDGWADPTIIDAYSGREVTYIKRIEYGPEPMFQADYEKMSVTLHNAYLLQSMTTSESQYAEMFASLVLNCLLESHPNMSSIMDSQQQAPLLSTVTV